MSYARIRDRQVRLTKPQGDAACLPFLNLAAERGASCFIGNGPSIIMHKPRMMFLLNGIQRQYSVERSQRHCEGEHTQVAALRVIIVKASPSR